MKKKKLPLPLISTTNCNSSNNVVVLLLLLLLVFNNDEMNKSNIKMLASATQTIHLRYQLKEEVPTGYFIGNVARDAFKDGDDVNHVANFRFKFLTTPSVRIQIDETTGDLRVSGRIDRESLCGKGSEMDLGGHRVDPRPKGSGGANLDGEATQFVCRVRQDVAVHPIFYFRIIKIMLEIEDINDNNPEFRPSFLIQEMQESSIVNQSSLSVPSPVDPDLGHNSIVDLELVDQDGIVRLHSGRKLDGSPDIKLFLIKKLDREQTSEHRLKVIAYDKGQPVRSGSIDITIVVIDVNDNQPRFEQKVYETTVEENLPVGSTILKVTAHDPDSGANGQVSYALSPSSQSAYGDVFSVDDLTGDLVVRGSVDYERSSVYRLLVSAIDGGTDPLPSETTVVIKVEDTNDNSPRIVVNSFVSSDASVADVQENSAPGTFVCHVIVDDPDSEEAGKFSCELKSRRDDSNSYEVQEKRPNDYDHDYFDGLNFDLRKRSIGVHNHHRRRDDYRGDYRDDYNGDDDDDGDRESFKLLQLVQNEYHVLSGRTFDREVEARFLLSIVCRDHGQPSLTSVKEIFVNVLDVNDNPPVFERHTYRAEVFENNFVGVHIVQVAATDIDSKNSSSSSSSSSSGPEYWIEDATSSFSIEKSGLVVASVALDREKHREHHFTVYARDQGEPPLTSSAEVSVKVLDVNDEAPKFARNQFRFEVPENRPSEAEVGVLEATDLDGPAFNEFRFSFHPPDDPDSEVFKLDPVTGRISTLSPLDREERKSYRFQVAVVDVQNSLLSSTATVLVRVADLNDETPAFLFPTSDNHTVRLSTSRARKKHLVARVAAVDGDEGPNGSISYEIVKGNELDIFVLDPTLGNLYVARDSPNGSPPLSNFSSFSLVLCARDSGPRPNKNFTFLNILLTDHWSDDNGDNGDYEHEADYDDGWFFFDFTSLHTRRVAVWAVTGISVVVVLLLLFTIATVLWKQRSSSKSLKQQQKQQQQQQQQQQKKNMNGSLKITNEINNRGDVSLSKQHQQQQQHLNKILSKSSAGYDINYAGDNTRNNTNGEIIKKIDLTNITEPMMPTNSSIVDDAAATLKVRSDSFDSSESSLVRPIPRHRDTTTGQHFQTLYNDFNHSRCSISKADQFHRQQHSPPPPPPPLDRDEVFQAASDPHESHRHQLQLYQQPGRHSSRSSRYQSLPRHPPTHRPNAHQPLVNPRCPASVASPSVCPSPGLAQRNLATALYCPPPPANISRFVPCPLSGVNDTVIFDGEIARVNNYAGSGINLRPMR